MKMYIYTLNTHTYSKLRRIKTVHSQHIFYIQYFGKGTRNTCLNYCILWQVSIQLSTACFNTYIWFAARDKTWEPVLAPESSTVHSAAQFNKQTLPGHSQAFLLSFNTIKVVYLEKMLVGDVRLRLWVYQVSPNHQILNALSWLNVDQSLGG